MQTVQVIKCKKAKFTYRMHCKDTESNAHWKCYVKYPHALVRDCKLRGNFRHGNHLTFRVEPKDSYAEENRMRFQLHEEKCKKLKQILSQIKWDRFMDICRSGQYRQLSNLKQVGKKTVASCRRAYQAMYPCESKDTFPKLNLILTEDDRRELQSRASVDGHGKWWQWMVINPFRFAFGPEVEDLPSKMVQDEKLHVPLGRRKTIAENAAEELGIQASDPRRRVYEALKIVEGHKWYRVSRVRPVHGLNLDGNPCLKIKDGYIALWRTVRVEEGIARELAAVTRRASPSLHTTLDELSGPFDDVQLDALRRCVASPVFALTGQAGTGKSLWATALYELYDTNVMFAAPTGKAVAVLGKRLTELHTKLWPESDNTEDSADNDDNGPLYGTLHSWLYRTCELPDVLVLDEQSMQSPEVLLRLLRKKRFNKVIFIGDDNQLPPVSGGQLFRDLIMSPRIPSAALTQIYRSGPGSLIVENAKLVLERNTELVQSDDTFTVVPVNSDWQNRVAERAWQIKESMHLARPPPVLVNKNDVRHALNSKLRYFLNPVRPEAYGCFPRARKGHRVVTVQNVLRSGRIKARKGATGTIKSVCDGEAKVHFDHGESVVYDHTSSVFTEELRQFVRETDPVKMDSKGLEVFWRFREHDRVMNISNQYEDVTDTDYDRKPRKLLLCNGAVGYVQHVEKKTLTVLFDNQVQRTYDSLSSVVPAYAMTVHKAQGSEYPAVIVVAKCENWMDANAYLYTAITRAKKRCVVFDADRNATKSCVKSERKPCRTFLCACIDTEFKKRKFDEVRECDDVSSDTSATS